MYCTHCGAMLVENANFCAKCGKKIRLAEEQGEDPQPVADDTAGDTVETTNGPDASPDEMMGARTDRFGHALEPMKPAESLALQDFIQALGSQTGEKKKGFHFYVQLDTEARKTVVTLVGMLPIISADAAKRDIPVVYVTPDTGSMSAARLDFRSFMILEHPLEFFTWDELNQFFERGARPHECWVIGDLDWHSTPAHNPDVLRAAERAIFSMVSNKKACSVFVHQEGRRAVVDLSAFRK